MTTPLYFQYGNYRHSSGEIILASIGSTVQYSGRGQAVTQKVTWTLNGVRQSANTQALANDLAILENAYALQNRDAALQGSNYKMHYLPTAVAIGGVRSMGVSYPTGEGAEATDWRSYSVTLEADYAVQPGDFILEFSETLSFQGTTGPKFVYLQVQDGPPEKQIVQTRTTMTATQSGSAVGFLSYPSPPPPLWPADEIEGSRQISPANPKYINGQRREFPISWNYSFESSSPLNGLPRS